MTTTDQSIFLIGAGPAGLAAAHELNNCGFQPLVIEHLPNVGGISRTEQYKGYRFDIGGHRFYTQIPSINQLWQTMLGDEFEERPRLSRIYYNQRFFPYPLQLMPTLSQLGFGESARILLSYLSARLLPSAEETSFDQWVTNRFGKRLFDTFFKSYTEKVWGIATDQIRAEWAAQRIKGLSLSSAVKNAIFGGGQNVKSLINEFYYPVHGPGMMWQAFKEEIEHNGGEVRCQVTATQLVRHGNRIASVHLLDHNSNHSSKPLAKELQVDQVISSMSLQNLVRSISPAPPDQVLSAAQGLRYRAFVLVGLIIKQENIFADNWIYIHEPNVKVGRIQNFKNWSPAMVPDPRYTSLGMEYFCNEGDELWQREDAALIALARQELAQLGLVDSDLVSDGCVIRQAKAYPIYDAQYQSHLAIIRDYLVGIENLQTIGRNGMHRYNNQDHSMLTGILAAQNVAGEKHDLWRVNTERSYYEEWTLETEDREVVDQPPTKSVFLSPD